MPEDNIFGIRLNKLRKERDLSLEDVAKIIGVTKATVSKYEKGINEPGMRVAIKLADYLKVSLDWLIGTSDDSEFVSKRSLVNMIESLTEENRKEALKYLQYIKTRNNQSN